MSEAGQEEAEKPSAAVEEARRRGPKGAIVLDHEYDGITEYDNPLPSWWSILYVLTVVHSIGYVIYYHFGPGETTEAAYVAQLKDYEGKKTLRDEAERANISEDVLKVAMENPAQLDAGKNVFVTRCASCHGQKGEGIIGPNLTDKFQLHGSSRMDIFTVVKRGVPGTAMLAWGEQLSAEEVRAVTAFAASLRGGNVAGKEPQGAPVEGF